MTVLNL